MWGCRHQGRRCPQTPHKRGILGCDKGPDERAYAWGAMSPLGGHARRRNKGHHSMGCIFLFFSTLGTKRGLGGSTEGYEASASTARSTNRRGTIVSHSEDNETLRWQQLSLLLLLGRWLVLAFIVSLIVLFGALFFTSAQAYAEDGGSGGGGTSTSGDSGGGGGGSGGGGSGGGGSGGGDGGSGGGGGGSDKSGSGGGGGDSTTTSG